MPTSSITKNFVISGKKQVKMFIDAIESSSNDSSKIHKISYTQIKGEDELRKFTEARKKANIK